MSFSLLKYGSIYVLQVLTVFEIFSGIFDKLHILRGLLNVESNDFFVQIFCRKLSMKKVFHQYGLSYVFQVAKAKETFLNILCKGMKLLICHLYVPLVGLRYSEVATSVF